MEEVNFQQSEPNMMIVSKTCIYVGFINLILTYKNIVPKLQFPNFRNQCLETEPSQTHQPTQTAVWSENPLELQFEWVYHSKAALPNTLISLVSCRSSRRLQYSIGGEDCVRRGGFMQGFPAE